MVDVSALVKEFPVFGGVFGDVLELVVDVHLLNRTHRLCVCSHFIILPPSLNCTFYESKKKVLW